MTASTDRVERTFHDAHELRADAWRCSGRRDMERRREGVGSDEARHRRPHTGTDWRGQSGLQRREGAEDVGAPGWISRPCPHAGLPLPTQGTILCIVLLRRPLRPPGRDGVQDRGAHDCIEDAELLAEGPEVSPEIGRRTVTRGPWESGGMAGDGPYSKANRGIRSEEPGQ